MFPNFLKSHTAWLECPAPPPEPIKNNLPFLSLRLESSFAIFSIMFESKVDAISLV